MRRKQLLGISLLLLAGCISAAAAASQLTDLNVASAGNMTTVTFKTSGAFTHNEYRPTDNLLLVDLAGVSPAKFANSTRDVKTPGVVSYHVLDYKGANGGEVTRVEISLLPGAMVHVSDVPNGLALRVMGDAFAAPAKPAEPFAKPAKPEAAAKTETAKPESKPESKRAAKTVASARPVTVESVSLSQGKDGMQVEIIGSGPMTAKAIRLKEPDRVVLDIANAVPGPKAHAIATTSGDVKGVRMGRFQAQPPVTRVVVDLAASREYEVAPAGNKLTLKLRGGEAMLLASNISAPPLASIAAAVPPAPISIPAAAVPAAPAKDPAKDAKEFVYLEPNYHPATPEAAAAAANDIAQKPATSADVKAEAKADPAARAAEAASRMRPEVTVNNLPAPPAAAAALSPKLANNPAAMQAAMAQAPAAAPAAAKPRYTGEPISVNLKDVDLKDFFRLIHEISGLNIVLDPNVRGSLTLVLDDVPWDQALDIVLTNNGLDKELQGNVLRIATVDTLRKEAEANRAKTEAQALAVDRVLYTHYLSYAQAKDVMPTIKKFLSQRGDLIADDRTNALIIQDIPNIIPEVQRLLVQLDRKSEQVEIEARVVAATRNFARDIGTQLGFGWGNSTSVVGGASAVGTSPLLINGLTPSFITIGNSIPLFSNQPAVGPTSGITVSNATNNYRLDFVLTMAETRGLLKILSRPRLVTQNNIQAVIRQGAQIPVVTAAQLGGPPTVTYVQAFLRLTVTPQITAEGTVFLNIDVENTVPDFGRQVNGNPTLNTQQETTKVPVTDGGTVMIGGVIQTQNSVNVSQVPLLGNIPVLGNAFRRRAVSTSTQELIFFITPKITQS